MQISSSLKMKPQTQLKAVGVQPPQHQQTSEPRDTVSITGGAGRGALNGAVGGVLATGLLIAGGAIAKYATNTPIDFAEMGVAVADAAALAVPPAILAGAATGAATSAAGMSRGHSQTASTTAGAVTGAATIGYAVYTALEALKSITHGT